MSALAVLNERPRLCSHRAERVQEIFDAFDTMNDGVIDVQEFWELCVGIGREITRDQAKEALSKLDLNGDGVVDFDEFFTWWVPFEQRMQEKIKVRPSLIAFLLLTVRLSRGTKHYDTIVYHTGGIVRNCCARSQIFMLARPSLLISLCTVPIPLPSSLLNFCLRLKRSGNVLRRTSVCARRPMSGTRST